jgi:hypothetical protein
MTSAVSTHVEEQPAALGQQGDRADLPDRVGQVAGQPHPQRRHTPHDRDTHPPPVDAEGAVMPAHRHQRPPTARKPGRIVTGLTALDTALTSLRLAGPPLARTALRPCRPAARTDRGAG